MIHSFFRFAQKSWSFVDEIFPRIHLRKIENRRPNDNIQHWSARVLEEKDVTKENSVNNVRVGRQLLRIPRTARLFDRGILLFPSPPLPCPRTVIVTPRIDIFERECARWKFSKGDHRWNRIDGWSSQRERERKRDGVDGVRAISLVYALRPKFQFSG